MFADLPLLLNEIHLPARFYSSSGPLALRRQADVQLERLHLGQLLWEAAVALICFDAALHLACLTFWSALNLCFSATKILISMCAGIVCRQIQPEVRLAQSSMQRMTVDAPDQPCSSGL